MHAFASRPAPFSTASRRRASQPLAQGVRIIFRENMSDHDLASRTMTRKMLMDICKERHLWTQPHLNKQLYLNHKGLDAIGALEEYFNVRLLHLENNNIGKIEGLGRMTELRCLYLGCNRLSVIEGLSFNVELRHLSLEANAIQSLDGLSHLTKLQTLNVCRNRIELVEVKRLTSLPNIVNLDISHNGIDVDTETCVDIWSNLAMLKVLRFHGNPCVHNITHYRKRMVNALPQLTYLDERPVFALDRHTSEAWCWGGFNAMQECRQEFQRAKFAECQVEPDRRDLITNRRKMAIERIEREARERAQPQPLARDVCVAVASSHDELERAPVCALIANDTENLSTGSLPAISEQKAFAFKPRPRVVKCEHVGSSIEPANFRLSGQDCEALESRQFAVMGDDPWLGVRKANPRVGDGTPEVVPRIWELIEENRELEDAALSRNVRGARVTLANELSLLD